MEIKQGDTVRVSEDAPRIYTPDWTDKMFSLELKVTEVEDGNASVEFAKRVPYRTVLTVIPTKYLVKVGAEKEAKFKVGDKVRVHYPIGDRIGRIREVMLDGTYDIDYGWGCTGHNITESQIEPYTEPTEQTEAEKNDRIDLKKEAEEWANTVSNAIKEYGDAMCKAYIEAHEEAYWQAYAADLAKEIVLKVANKYTDPKQAAEYAVQTAEAVVAGLKRK